MPQPKPIPEGYHSLTPYLIVKGGAKALEFYEKAFGAEELYRMPMPEGRVAHAEMRIGDSIFMLADEVPGRDIRAPQGSPPVHLMIYCEGVDAMWKRARGAGARSCGRCRTSSTATAAGPSRIRSGISGRWRPTSGTSLPRRSSAGWRSRSDPRRPCSRM